MKGEMKPRKSVRRRFFRRIFAQNLIRMLFPILLMSVFMIGLFYSEAANRRDQSNIQKREQLDNLLGDCFRKAESIAYQVEMNLSLKTALKTWYHMEQPRHSIISRVTDFSSSLSRITYVDPLVKQIYYYLYNENDRLLVPGSGMVSLSEYSNTSWLEHDQRETDPLWLWLGDYEDDSTHIHRDALFCGKKIYSGLVSSHQIGVLVAVCDLDTVQKALSASEFSENQYTGILYARRLVCGDMPDWLLEANRAAADDIFANMPSGGMSRLSGSLYTCDLLPSQIYEDYSYISVTSAASMFKLFGQAIVISVISTLCTIVFCIFLAWRGANREYQNVMRIYDLISTPEREPLPQSSLKDASLYDYIIQNLVQMFVREDYLRVRESEQRYQMEALKLQSLQFQINPHFLHNALNVIYWQAVDLTKGQNLCVDSVQKLSSMMRYILDDPEKLATVEEEIAYLDDYLYLQRERFGSLFDVDYRIDDQLWEFPVIRTILQPIVENAITHGIRKREVPEGGIIRIHVHAGKFGIRFSIADNGAGMDQETLEKVRERIKTGNTDGHVGLANTSRRLVLYYGGHAALQIHSVKGKGTAVCFLIGEKGHNDRA